MRSLTLTLLLAAAATGAALAQSGAPVFRSTAESVSVNVSVKKGNNVVANLDAADFRLLDNGVQQTIAAVSIEAVPIDVTLFLDTSGSTAGRLEAMKRDIAGILPMLRPEDRFRLLTIGDSVYETVPWSTAGSPIDLSFQSVNGRSLISDAIAMALMHRVAPERRHLIVAMTDREDGGSVLPSGMVLELSRRADAVLHIVDQHGGGSDLVTRARTSLIYRRGNTTDNLRDAAEATGGELHDPFFGSASVLRAFTKIFSDYRQSYVLRYTPSGVTAPGWHALAVTVPGHKGVTVHARSGYYGR
jgi:VWFA-related protein